MLLERTVIGLIGRTESIVIDYEQYTSYLVIKSVGMDLDKFSVM